MENVRPVIIQGGESCKEQSASPRTTHRKVADEASIDMLIIAIGGGALLDLLGLLLRQRQGLGDSGTHHSTRSGRR